MLSNKMKLAGIAVLFASLILTACGAGTPPTPTTDPNLIITQVAQTIEANLALTASAQPTATYTAEPTQVLTETSTPAVTPLPIGTPGSPTLGFPTIAGVSPDSMIFSADVTIPDNTQLAPSTEFTKTWRMKNTGTTTWNSNYQLVYWDGVNVNEIDKVLPVKQVKLSGEVKPGAEGEVSVKMVAPSKNGTYKIWWRLLNPAGSAFGDQLYVLIVVNDGTIAVVPSVTPTSTATP